MKKGLFKRLASGIVSGLMCLTMLPQGTASYAASVGDKLSVGGGMNQHKGVCDGYSYEVWIDNTGGSGSMTLGSGASFKAEWSANVNAGNFLARRGLDFGSQKKATDYPYIGMDYEADYKQTGSASGNSRLCVYGWFQNKGAGNVPLVEYYIIEDWVDWCPDGNGKMVTIDGAQYKIFQMDHTGPTINGGSETFKQYFSVRQQKRTSGHITVSDHFKAWANEGWGIGNLYEVALNAEGWQSSGVADVKKLDVYTDPSGNPGTDPGTDPGTPSVPSTPSVEPDANGYYFHSTFESSSDSWTGRGDASVKTDSSNYVAGSKSLFVSGRTDNWHGAAIELDSSAFVPGNTYSFSTGVLQKSGSATEMKMTLQYTSGGQENYDEVASVSAKSGEWTKLENTSFTIPAGATNMILYVEAPDSLTDFYIDEAIGGVKGTKSTVTTGSGTVSGGSTTPSNPNDPSTPSNPPTSSSDALKDAFAPCFKIGTSVSPHELGSGADFIKKHFNSITPENELKPDALLQQGASQQSGSNTRAAVSLDKAAQTLKFCESNGIALRGHTFVWYSQTPDWFFRENFSSTGAYVSKDIMNQRLENFIKDTFDALATQYPKLNVYSYDVCNELFVNDGGGLRPGSNSNWTRIYGDTSDEFIINAFTYARKYAPAGCKLYINDYNEYIPAKTNDIYNIAMKLKELGVIDGIGMQSHLDVSYPSAQVYKTALEKFLSTGLEVQITELDITTSGDYNAQAALFKAVFQMAVDNADKIPALTVWGTNDSISWRSSQNPLLFSQGYKPKPAYDAVMEVAAGITPGTPSDPNQPNQPSTGVTKWGDVNCDGIVSMADAAAILQFLGNADKYPISDQGKLNGDVINNGDGLTSKDAVTIQEYVAKVISSLPVGDIATQPAQTTTKPQPTTTTTTTTKAPSVGGVDISWIDPNKPMVAISFDDGASPNTGTRIINALDKSGFHATFFYVGNWIGAGDGENEVRYAYSKGMEIANHTTTHPNLTEKSANEIRQEVDGCYNKLKNIIGAEPSKLLRLPYLAGNQTVSSTLNDYGLITCKIDTKDWDNASKDQIVGTIKNAMNDGSLNGAIVLCHETYDSTAGAMEELCPYLKSQGWQIVTISEMAAVKGKTLGGGQTYTNL